MALKQRIVIILQKGRPVQFPGSPSIERIQNGRVYLNRVGAHAFNSAIGGGPRQVLADRARFVPPHVCNAIQGNINYILNQKHETALSSPTYHPHNPEEVLWHNVSHDDGDETKILPFPHKDEAHDWDMIHKNKSLLSKTYNHLHNALLNANIQSGHKGAVVVYPLLPKHYYINPVEASMEARKQTLRHENVHRERDSAIGSPDNLLHSADLNALAGHPLFMRSISTLLRHGYDSIPANHLPEELFARLLAGQGQHLGMSNEESLSLLHEISRRVFEKHGDKFYDIIRAATPSIRSVLYGKNQHYQRVATPTNIVRVNR